MESVGVAGAIVGEPHTCRGAASPTAGTVCAIQVMRKRSANARHPSSCYRAQSGTGGSCGCRVAKVESAYDPRASYLSHRPLKRTLRIDLVHCDLIGVSKVACLRDIYSSERMHSALYSYVKAYTSSGHTCHRSCSFTKPKVAKVNSHKKSYD